MVCMPDKDRRVGRMSGDAGAQCEMKTPMTSGHTDDPRSHDLPGAQLLVGSSRNW